VTAPEPPPIDERVLVDRTLQRYRTAYDRLDARLAQAVYPGIDGSALARAFDGLESQSIRFDACDVAVEGDAATATCRGTSRYVPKIGSREPRLEARVWTFTLQKADGAWMIAAARASR
jgi:hypothetical protein